MCWVQSSTQAVFQYKATALYEGSMKVLFLREKEETTLAWEGGQAAWKNSALIYFSLLPVPIYEVMKHIL